MADDSWDVDVNLDFHPCDKPHGMKDYIRTDLTPHQQEKLNKLKRDKVVSDQKYLAAHPEIRGIIIMILRMVLKHRPKINIQEFIGMYFTQSSVDIQQDVIDYLKEREEILAESSFVLEVDTKSTEVMEEEELVVEKEVDVRKSVVEWDDEVELRVDKYTDEEVCEESEVSEEQLKTSEEDLSSAMRICQGVLHEMIDLVLDEIDLPSLESFGLDKLVDYDDHAFGSTSFLLKTAQLDDDDDDDDD